MGHVFLKITPRWQRSAIMGSPVLPRALSPAHGTVQAQHNVCSSHSQLHLCVCVRAWREEKEFYWEAEACTIFRGICFSGGGGGPGSSGRRNRLPYPMLTSTGWSSHPNPGKNTFQSQFLPNHFTSTLLAMKKYPFGNNTTSCRNPVPHFYPERYALREERTSFFSFCKHGEARNEADII